MYNVRAAVYNYTVVRTADYEFPSAAQLKEGEPKSVLRHTAFAMEWSSLRNATEYAVSIYAEDHKGVASDQSVASTTFFITTDAIRCAAADGWDSAHGRHLGAPGLRAGLPRRGAALVRRRGRVGRDGQRLRWVWSGRVRRRAQLLRGGGRVGAQSLADGGDGALRARVHGHHDSCVRRRRRVGRGGPDPVR